MLATLALFLLMLTPPAAQASTQDQRFVPVEGATLQARQEAAASRAAAASPQTPYWTAYSFDVRPGVATDFEWVGDDGTDYTAALADLHMKRVENRRSRGRAEPDRRGGGRRPLRAATNLSNTSTLPCVRADYPER